MQQDTASSTTPTTTTPETSHASPSAGAEPTKIESNPCLEHANDWIKCLIRGMPLLGRADLLRVKELLQYFPASGNPEYGKKMEPLVYYMRDLVESELTRRYTNPDESVVFYEPRILRDEIMMNYADNSPERLADLENKFKRLPKMWDMFFYTHARYPWYKDNHQLVL